MSASLVLDALIIILLGATIGYGAVLNRRLAVLRTNQAELQGLITTLNEATKRAETGIAGLKAGAEQAGAGLQSSIDKARRLNEELAYRMENSSKISERDRGLTASNSDTLRPESRRQIEREILSALRTAR